MHRRITGAVHREGPGSICICRGGQAPCPQPVAPAVMKSPFSGVITIARTNSREFTTASDPADSLRRRVNRFRVTSKKYALGGQLPAHIDPITSVPPSRETRTVADGDSVEHMGVARARHDLGTRFTRRGPFSALPSSVCPGELTSKKYARTLSNVRSARFILPNNHRLKYCK